MHAKCSQQWKCLNQESAWIKNALAIQQGFNTKKLYIKWEERGFFYRNPRINQRSRSIGMNDGDSIELEKIPWLGKLTRGIPMIGGID